MAQNMSASGETEELVFRKPRDQEVGGIIAAVGCFAFLLFNIYLAHLNVFTSDPDHVRARFNQFAPKFLEVAFTIMGFCGLYLGCPSILRFDLRRGVYELREGWFPFQWTYRGTLADIQSVYVARRTSSTLVSNRVQVRWKQGGLRWKGSSKLLWYETLSNAEAKAREIAKKLDVPCGPTEIARQRSIGS